MIDQVKKIIIHEILSCNDTELLDLIAGMLLSERKEAETESTPRLQHLRQRFEGFGETRTAPEWAQLLGIHRTTAWRCLYKRGLSVEAMARLKHIKYPKPNTEKTDE